MASMRERFIRVMREGDVSKGFPIIEWAPFWHLTLENWKEQGLPAQAHRNLHKSLGLEDHRQAWIPAITGDTLKLTHDGAPIVRDEKGYEEALPTLYPEVVFDPLEMEKRAKLQTKGTAILWLTLDGPFWFPRILLGVEPHMYAFFEKPDLMKRINRDLTEFNIRAIETICRFYRPDFMTFAEDMSYNHGPMISRALFDEFMAPYYREMVPVLKKYDIIPMVDSDGDVEPIIPWFESVGVEGILPLERMAGVDVTRIRRNHPNWKMIGGFDKMVMHLGEKAMRAEFQRIKPAVLAGRYIPSVDHQTPPDVTLENYKLYVRLLREFSDEVARESRPVESRKAKRGPSKAKRVKPATVRPSRTKKTRTVLRKTGKPKSGNAASRRGTARRKPKRRSSA